MLRRGLIERPTPGEPGQFAWADRDVIAAQLDAAGFVEYEIADVIFESVYASLEDYWETQSAMSGRMQTALAGVDRATIEDMKRAIGEAVERYTAPDGSIVLPSRTWVAAAEA
jgi:hypothetical protein